MTLDTYRLLRRSGLRVSPLALGTTTFGADCGWRAYDAESRKTFDIYVEWGGNFIDEASQYTNGTSERLLDPITGNHGRLKILHEAYDGLANGTSSPTPATSITRRGTIAR